MGEEYEKNEQPQNIPDSNLKILTEFFSKKLNQNNEKMEKNMLEIRRAMEENK